MIIAAARSSPHTRKVEKRRLSNRRCMKNIATMVNLAADRTTRDRDQDGAQPVQVDDDHLYDGDHRQDEGDDRVAQR